MLIETIQGKLTLSTSKHLKALFRQS